MQWCADSKCPTRGLDPVNCGWQKEETGLVPQWFEGQSLPETDEIVTNSCESSVDASMEDSEPEEALWTDDSDVWDSV